MVKIKSLLTRLVLLSLVFVMSLVTVIMTVAEGLPFPYIEAIFCFLVLFGIVMTALLSKGEGLTTLEGKILS
ncbi:MAG TPA: hypothetical protein PKO28_04295, partial [Bacilli bacterium]|nr:hypothetical protein [Bacilli bacterium]